MRSAWYSRAFFLLVGAIGIGGVLSGTACTRWGQPGPIMPTVEPLSSIYVSASMGSDTSGNGTQTKPYKSLTKAVNVLASSKVLSTSGVSIYLASGDYDRANGERFPIVIPTSVTLTGANYGSGLRGGAFVDGYGEDTTFERLVGAPPRTAYAALVIAPAAAVSLSDIYVGASKLQLPSSRAAYASFDVMGSLNATTATLGAGVVSIVRNANGVVVAGGSLSCTSCAIRGNGYGVGAFAAPVATASPAGPPSITLSHSTGDSTISARGVDIITDGSVDVTVSGEVFESGAYAFEDSFPPLLASQTRGALDFGGGASSSSGGNILIGARSTEISIMRRFETLYALDDTWNPGQQQANRHGQYVKTHMFPSDTHGKNVTIARNAAGSTVTVGPVPVPTPSPSSSPSSSPAPTATPT